MVDKSPAITAEEFATWPLPRDAIKRLAHLDRRTAILTIFRRLQRGLLRAFARDSIINDKAKGSVLIDPSAWEYAAEGIAASPFWQTADITILVPDNRYDPMAVSVSIDFFGVRFDPAGIQAMLPDPVAPPAQETPQSATEIDQTNEQREPRVADDHLRAWFEVYRKAYPGSQDTEDRALASAAGMFPGKSVSRRRVRELRGAQKRGRKPQGEP